MAKEDLAPLALGLAAKVLDPPERGWHRGPADARTAACFAGLGPDIEPPGFSPAAAKAALLLDSVLALVLLNERDRTRPLLLYQADEGQYLLVDVDGLFPVAWRTDAAEFFSLLVAAGSPLLIIPRDTAAPEVLAALDNTGLRFVTDAPPSRGERWRTLPDRRWTNDGATPDLSLARAGRELNDIATELMMSWSALAVDRRAPFSVPTSLDRHLSLAAGAALAQLAWTLWRDREPTAPHLALTRFGDLDGRARFEEDVVLVRLPHGRRHQDLFEHRLLDDVPFVPWLGGRTLRFGGV
jgi:hypothetical protein